MAPATKRRKLETHSGPELDVDGDQDWQSDEISSLPGSDEEEDEESDEEEEEGDYSGSGSDEEEDDQSIPRANTGTTVEVVIPVEADTTIKRKRGRPKKEPVPKPPTVPKKRGRPRKYPVGEEPKYRRSRRKLNPDGSFKKRGRPKKIIKPEDIVPKIPKKRGRPRKHPLPEGEEAPKTAKRPKKEFDLLAGLDLDFDDDHADSTQGGMDGDEADWQDDPDASAAIEKEDDILAKLRRRILYRQHDAELQDFVEASAPSPARQSPPRPSVATAVSTPEPLDTAPKAGLPAPVERVLSSSDIPSAEKRKDRQPFEPVADQDVIMEIAKAATNLADASSASIKRGKGRPSGAKNRQPDWHNNALFSASRGVEPSPQPLLERTEEEERVVAALGAAAASSAMSGSSASKANGMSNLVKPTSSDAFFLFNTSKKARGAAGLAIGTSTNLISEKLGALQPSSLEDVVYEQTKTGSVSHMASSMYRRLLSVYTAQLLAGYSIVFHGVGSKLDLLTQLVRDRIESHGDAVGIVAQGAIRAFKVEDMLAQIESAIGLGPMSSASGQLEQDPDMTSTLVASTLTVSRAHRVAAYFGTHQQELRHRRKANAGPDRMFLVLQTFDAPGMQNSRFRTVLEILGACSNIHIMATVEHVNSGLVTGSHVEATMDTETADKIGDHRTTPRLTWIWQNMSTYVPSLNEMLLMRSNGAFSSWIPVLPSALDLLGSTGRLHGHGGIGAGGGTEATTLFNGLAVSESASNVSDQSAISILKSVTTKARALFNLVAKQILAMPSGDPAVATKEGIVYVDLLAKAKKGFLVSNEADFKSLLVEFLDHQLLQVSRQGKIRIGLENAQVLRDVVERLKTL